MLFINLEQNSLHAASLQWAASDGSCNAYGLEDLQRCECTLSFFHQSVLQKHIYSRNLHPWVVLRFQLSTCPSCLHD